MQEELLLTSFDRVSKCADSFVQVFYFEKVNLQFTSSGHVAHLFNEIRMFLPLGSLKLSYEGHRTAEPWVIQLTAPQVQSMVLAVAGEVTGSVVAAQARLLGRRVFSKRGYDVARYNLLW